MSYCRWSSDYGECDVYVYTDVSGGWTTHVASRRFKNKVPEEIKAMPCSTGEEYYEMWKELEKWRETQTELLELEDISPYAGKSFNDATPKEAAQRLIDIRESGLNVPQYVIDDLLLEELVYGP